MRENPNLTPVKVYEPRSHADFIAHVQHFEQAGWTQEFQDDGSVLMVAPRHFMWKREHLLVGAMTFWSLGIGNYLLYRNEKQAPKRVLIKPMIAEAEPAHDPSF